MLRKNLSEMTIGFTIVPAGPILIKSGVEGHADPTIPDMNFVRTVHPDTGERTVYLPGSSLKGVFRSYAEKIARTVGSDVKDVVADPNAYKDLNDPNIPDSERYEKSDCIARLFGSQVLASRIRFKDAFPTGEVTIEQRTNVSIDRKLGSVKAGPFDMEVVTSGEFGAGISVRNFELWQIGLLGLILRDLSNGRIKIGYAKTRGLGDVRIALQDVEIDILYSKLHYEKAQGDGKVLGLDKLLTSEEVKAYGIEPNLGDLDLRIRTKDKEGWGTNLNQEIRGEEVEIFLKECVKKHWAKFVTPEA
jgi:CRISPR-associated RAMP protein (TIGR02581 family)